MNYFQNLKNFWNLKKFWELSKFFKINLFYFSLFNFQNLTTYDKKLIIFSKYLQKFEILEILDIFTIYKLVSRLAWIDECLIFNKKRFKNGISFEHFWGFLENFSKCYNFGIFFQNNYKNIFYFFLNFGNFFLVFQKRDNMFMFIYFSFEICFNFHLYQDNLINLEENCPDLLREQIWVRLNDKYM